MPSQRGSILPTNHFLQHPVEVKGSWPELIHQASTYAQVTTASLVPAICVSMLPQYAMVLGYSHTESSFHLLFNLFFHRGGLTSSSAPRKINMIFWAFFWPSCPGKHLLAFPCGATVARWFSLLWPVTNSAVCRWRRFCMTLFVFVGRGRAPPVVSAKDSFVFSAESTSGGPRHSERLKVMTNGLGSASELPFLAEGMEFTVVCVLLVLCAVAYLWCPGTASRSRATGTSIAIVLILVCSLSLFWYWFCNNQHRDGPEIHSESYLGTFFWIYNISFFSYIDLNEMG